MFLQNLSIDTLIIQKETLLAGFHTDGQLCCQSDKGERFREQN